MNKPHKLPCEKVIEDNIGLVKTIVSRFNVSKFDKDDLMQAGLIGLWKAAYHYNEEMGVKFSTYSVKYILGEIKNELKNLNVIKVSRKYYSIINELKKNEKIDEEDIMKRLSCTSYDIAFAYSLSNNIIRLTDEEIVDRDYSEKILTKKDKMIEAVKKLLETNKLTQKEIANRLKISQSTVSRIIKIIKHLE